MVSRSKRKYLTKIKGRYKRANRKAKARILDEFCEVCGHHRKHAIRLLNQKHPNKRKRPGRPPKYGKKEREIIENIWLNSDRPCSARLIGTLREWLPAYEIEYGALDEHLRNKILGIRPRTLDRLLTPSRKRYGTRGLSGTRSVTILKNQIPIKTSHHAINKPGYMAADTVAHCGNSLEGSFVWSLTFTDIFSGWTENAAVWNKGQHGVCERLRIMEEKLYFELKGFHSDNGGEFINYHLHSYYRNREENPIEMTRGRPGKKNDNPHVEQKNWTHVRCLLGYSRIDDQKLVKKINDLYALWNQLNNFFCASRRLILKEKRGSKYYKKYDEAMTPCERLLKSGALSAAQKEALSAAKLKLNPYQLRKAIDSKQNAILKQLR